MYSNVPKDSTSGTKPSKVDRAIEIVNRAAVKNGFNRIDVQTLNTLNDDIRNNKPQEVKSKEHIRSIQQKYNIRLDEEALNAILKIYNEDYTDRENEPLDQNTEQNNDATTDQFSREYNITPQNDDKPIPSLGEKLQNKVSTWAKSHLDLSNLFQINCEKSNQTLSELSNIASEFNVACVILGDVNFSKRKTEKNYVPKYRLYYGQNKGYNLWKSKSKDLLKKSDALMNHLVTIGFESWPPENCAEVDAIQQATTDGVELENAHMFTVQHKNNNFIPKAACLNCTASFGSSIKDRNYSGWSNNATNATNIEKFINILENAYNEITCKRKDVKTLNSTKRDDLHLSDLSKALKSYNTITSTGVTDD